MSETTSSEDASDASVVLWLQPYISISHSTTRGCCFCPGFSFFRHIPCYPGKQRKGKETGKYVIVDNSFGNYEVLRRRDLPCLPPLTHSIAAADMLSAKDHTMYVNPPESSVKHQPIVSLNATYVCLSMFLISRARRILHSYEMVSWFLKS